MGKGRDLGAENSNGVVSSERDEARSTPRNVVDYSVASCSNKHSLHFNATMHCHTHTHGGGSFCIDYYYGFSGVDRNCVAGDHSIRKEEERELDHQMGFLAHKNILWAYGLFRLL